MLLSTPTQALPVWLSPFGTQTSWLLLLDIVTPEFSGTLDFSDPFRKNSRNSGLHTDPWISRTFSSDFTFSSFQYTNNRTAVNSCQLDLVLDPWTHKHVWTPARVTFVTPVVHPYLRCWANGWHPDGRNGKVRRNRVVGRRRHVWIRV